MIEDEVDLGVELVGSKKLVENDVGGFGGGDLPDAFFGCFGCFGWFVLFCCLAYLCSLPRVFPFSSSENHVARLEKTLVR